MNELNVLVKEYIKEKIPNRLNSINILRIYYFNKILNEQLMKINKNY